MEVYKHTCPICGYVTWSDKGDKVTHSKCNVEYNTEWIEFDNVFNIQKFLKAECKPLQVSKPVIAMAEDFIKTFMVIVADHSMRKAQNEGAKTFLPDHFDWNVIEEFKLYLDAKKQDAAI